MDTNNELSAGLAVIPKWQKAFFAAWADQLRKLGDQRPLAELWATFLHPSEPRFTIRLES